jgi:hypothetical protein
VEHIVATLEHREMAHQPLPGETAVNPGDHATQRSLRRILRLAGLPRPQVFLRFVALLWVLWRAYSEGVSATRIATRAGLDPERIRRARRQLVPQASVQAPASLFVETFVSLAEMCGVSRSSAAALLRTSWGSGSAGRAGFDLSLQVDPVLVSQDAGAPLVHRRYQQRAAVMLSKAEELR